MSTLKADTIVASDGSSPVTLTKQSAAKAFAHFQGTGTVAIDESFGCSSLADNATGKYTLTLTSAMSSTTYTPQLNSARPSISFCPACRTFPVTASTVKCETGDYNSTYLLSGFLDHEEVYSVIHGDLA